MLNVSCLWIYSVVPSLTDIADLCLLFSFIPLIRNIWILLIYKPVFDFIEFLYFYCLLNVISYCSYFLSSPYFGFNLFSFLKILKIEVLIIDFFQSFFFSNNKSTNAIIFLSEHWFWSICQLLLEIKSSLLTSDFLMDLWVI